MLQSILDDAIEYIEDKEIEELDKGKQVSLYELEIFGIKLVLTIGNINNEHKSKNILYTPVYLVVSKDSIEKIGYYEFYSSELSSILDEDGDLDLSSIEGPLLFDYVDSDYIINTMNKSTFLREFTLEEETYLNELAGEDGGESKQPKPEDLDDEEEDSQEIVDDIEQVDNIQKLLKENETKFKKQILLKYKTMYLKDKKSSVITSTSNWLQKHFKNKEYGIVDVESNGDCFFATIREALKGIKINISAETLRNILAKKMKEENYQTYKENYDGFNKELLDLKKEKEELLKRNKLIKKQYTEFGQKAKQFKIERNRDEMMAAIKEQKKIKQENATIKGRFTQLEVELKRAVLNLNEFKFMKNINSIEDFREAIKKKSYWADSSAIHHLEELLNVKFVILSKDNYDRGNYNGLIMCGDMISDTVLKRGVYKPKYYIIATLSGNHYELITYKNKKIFSFYEIPYDILLNIKRICSTDNVSKKDKKTLYNYIPIFASFLSA